MSQPPPLPPLPLSPPHILQKNGSLFNNASFKTPETHGRTDEDEINLASSSLLAMASGMSDAGKKSAKKVLLANSPLMLTDIGAHSAGSVMANPQDVTAKEFSKKAFLLVKTPGTPFSASSLNGDSLDRHLEYANLQSPSFLTSPSLVPSHAAESLSFLTPPPMTPLPTISSTSSPSADGGFSFGSNTSTLPPGCKCSLVSNAGVTFSGTPYPPARIDDAVPDYPSIVNFPQFLVNKRSEKGGLNLASRNCVMCGKECLMASNDNKRKHAAKEVNINDDNATIQSALTANCAAIAGDEKGAATLMGLTKNGPLIPTQNKGMCSLCDRAIWSYHKPATTSPVTPPMVFPIKWCKGCKNFRMWELFGQKGNATKCERCRSRQKTQYTVLKKGKGRK